MTRLVFLAFALVVSAAAYSAPADTTPPLFDNAVVGGDGTQLTLSYIEANSLDAASIPAVTDYIINGGAVTVTGVVVNDVDNTVSLTLSAAIAVGDSVTLSYSGGVLRDTAGNAAVDLVSEGVVTSAVNYASSYWISLTPSGGSQFDYYSDQQTGQADSDLVGDAGSNPGVQVHFYDNGSTSTTDGDL